jgi:hypothetical protein
MQWLSSGIMVVGQVVMHLVAKSKSDITHNITR